MSRFNLEMAHVIAKFGKAFHEQCKPNTYVSQVLNSITQCRTRSLADMLTCAIDTHRVAITNNRLLSMDEKSVTFLHKDYNDESRIKPVTLPGIEFLRRFCLHILPLRFVKIRRYRLYSLQQKAKLQKLKGAKKVLKLKLSTQERIKSLLGIAIYSCKECGKGQMIAIEVIPRKRSPATYYNIISNTH